MRAIETSVTKKLGIRHPVLLAPMDIISDSTLAMAVSAAGGFGILGGGYGNEVWLRRQLEAADASAIGIGFITWSLQKGPRLLDIALEHQPKAIVLSFGDPAPLAARVKAAGILLICQVQTVALAQDAVAKGADIVIAQGTEGGGHGGSVSTFPLVPAIVDAVGHKVPVVAAGGIADGRGLAAALALGAGAVLMGTRFYASTEAAAPAAAKARIVAASGDQTTRGILFDIVRRNVWPAPFTGRVLVNDHVRRWQGRERDLMQHVDEEAERFNQAREREDYDTAGVIAGESSGLITDIKPAGEIVEDVMRQATEIMDRHRVYPAN